MTDLGTDIATPGGLDLDPTFGTASGFRCLGEALARRIVTQRGSLFDDPSYGTDIRARLNDNLSPAQVYALGASVRNEWLQDARVEDCSVAASLTPSGALSVRGVVQTAAGPFRLVLEISAVTAVLLTVEPV
jgi:hypothetical protein